MYIIYKKHASRSDMYKYIYIYICIRLAKLAEGIFLYPSFCENNFVKIINCFFVKIINCKL